MEPSILELNRLGVLADLRKAVCEVEACMVYFFFFLLKADVLEESYHAGTLLSNCGVNEGVTLTLLHVTVLLRLSTALQASASRRCVGIVAF